MTNLTSLILGLYLLTGSAVAQVPQEQAVPEPLPVEEPRIEIFDIADLVREAAERRGDWERLDTDARPLRRRRMATSSTDQGAVENDSDRRQEQGAKALAELLSAFVEPALIEGHEDIEALGNTHLVARVRLAQRDWLQRMLETYRQDSDRLIETEWRYIRLKGGAAESLGLTAGLQIVGDDQPVMTRLEKPSGDVLHAPKITTFNGQRFSISVVSEIAFIQDYHVYEDVEPTGERIVDPVVEVVQNGVTLDGQALLLGENLIGLRFEMTHSEVEQPIEIEETPHGAIGVPVVHRSKSESRCTLVSGQSLVIVGQDSAGRDIIEILRLKLID